MFIVLLRFAENRASAAEHMSTHQQWIKQGLDDQVFLLIGGILPGLGGAVLAHGTTMEQLRDRVAQDPFVADRIVDAEILQITPGMADERQRLLIPAS